ncbi:MAG TPA: hypothetical protein VF393_00015 [archaeon]
MKAPSTDAGTSTIKIINGITLSPRRSTIVGFVGIGSTDEVALTKNNSSNP